ncbi:MAG: hypothetical protein J7545_02505 [Roseofilum sp. SBFL]|uniref:hypothetical protein n=1 Tax=unclassified Roseofilum TaxID=2620099 RepID=UPI001AFDB66A|nr:MULTISPECIES: hypothetical protein [unclassified Roseofilum]MBP0013242.1 hypothetical protein [Roseofilum sp. SID3]MBP0026412.1 hypothetical protein [Roseofilum sp. SID2]MBP0038243.1 hypothetical protein [Roseofilum sp. SID1]MBP0040836.1 hypothetical protein [Roseofilum sp. SBFL]
MSKPIFELVDELPTDNITIKSLRALDFVVPGEWNNLVGFENSIRTITGEEDPEMIEAIGNRAIELFNDKAEGYQRALWLYQTVSGAGRALGAASLANMVGDKIPLVGGLLTSLTPKPGKAQTIDLSLKVVAELLGFCSINGIPGDSIGDFVGALGDYSGESLMRMAALVCFDGLIPLGPDFLGVAADWIGGLSTSDLEQNQGFRAIEDAIPGGDKESKLGFIGESFGSVSNWMGDFVSDRGITPTNVANSLQSFVEFSDDKLDYLAAFLDVSTNYYEHTGIQTLAHRLIERAVAEI